MEKFNLTVQSNRGPLSVDWSDEETLARYSNIQAGFYLEDSQDLSPALLKKHFYRWNQMFWEMREENGMFDFPDGSVIVDIGSGIAVADLLLYSYIPNSKFYLIDKEGWDEFFANSVPPNVCYDNEYPIYNSWAPVRDAIKTSNFDPARFVMQGPNDEFPKDVDVVTSYISWCFHYPKEVYWDKVMSNLKKGGKLLLDVRVLSDRDVIGEISEELKSTPVEIKFPKLPDYVDDYPAPSDEHSWSRCLWTKNV